jgi:hypothetical protein
LLSQSFLYTLELRILGFNYNFQQQNSGLLREVDPPLSSHFLIKRIVSVKWCLFSVILNYVESFKKS